MKTTYFTLLASAAVLGLGACATTSTATEDGAIEMAAETAAAKPDDAAGENRRERREQRPTRGGSHSKTDFYNVYDADKDGTVTIAEYRAVRDEGYDARDPDGDAKVLPDEYVAEYEGRLEQDIAEMRDRQIKQAYVRFGVLDKDKDGIITREEFQASGQRMFDRLDENKDGIVDDSDGVDAF